MLIVLFIGLLLIALVAILLKRRHTRKADQINSSFNAGITTRAAPTAPPDVRDSSYISNTQISAPISAHGGRDSPARTREAFMPYGYGYTRSGSRLASRVDVPRGGTPIDEMEKEAGVGALDSSPDSIQPASRPRKVLVRERSRIGSETEKMMG
jgi:hypothetical protein